MRILTKQNVHSVVHNEKINHCLLFLFQCQTIGPDTEKRVSIEFSFE